MILTYFFSLYCRRFRKTYLASTFGPHGPFSRTHFKSFDMFFERSTRLGKIVSPCFRYSTNQCPKLKVWVSASSVTVDSHKGSSVPVPGQESQKRQKRHRSNRETRDILSNCWNSLQQSWISHCSNLFLRNFDWRRSGKQQWLSNSLFTTQIHSVSFDNLFTHSNTSEAWFFAMSANQKFPQGAASANWSLPPCVKPSDTQAQ